MIIIIKEFFNKIIININNTEPGFILKRVIIININIYNRNFKINIPIFIIFGVNKKIIIIIIRLSFCSE